MRKWWNIKTRIALALIVLLASSAIYFAKSSRVKTNIPLSDGSENQEALLIPTEVASSGNVADLGSTSISWPGEILSNKDALINSSRDGQIANLYVKIGDSVVGGQIIGLLSPPTSTLELTALLAEKKQALINVQAQADATEKIVIASKKRLEKIEAAIYRSRDTALDVAEKEAQQNSNSTTGADKELEAIKVSRLAAISTAQTEVTQAEALLPTKYSAMRAAAKALSQRFAGALSINGTAPDSSEKLNYFQFDAAYGYLNTSTRQDYVTSLRALLDATNKTSYTPENEANSYVQASLKLITNTIATDFITPSTMSNLRNIIFEDEQIFTEALQEYKDAQNDVSVKKAKLEQMKVDYDKDIVTAESNVKVNLSFIETIESMKASQIAEADEEFAKEKSSLESKIGELNKQLELANAQVEAATAAYELIEKGIGEEIRAPQSGIISAIYKKVGDYVTVDMPVAVTSSNSEKDRFARFRIPVDMRLPAEGEEVTIVRPGYPLEQKKARIVGIGLALDESGSFQADAEFIDPIDWPVNVSIRVLAPSASSFILVPFTALWWDDKEVAHIWLVDDESSITSQAVELGRAIGDRIEIEKGLEEGEKFVVEVQQSLRDGMVISESLLGAPQASASKDPTEKQAGHGHNDL